MLQPIKNQYHLVRAMLANAQHGFPGKKLKIIGVTGTDGKTTTANYVYHVLKASGKKVALISTISAVIDDEEYQTGFHVTTPGSGAVQTYLKKAKEKGVEYVVLEVTSHALDQNRVWGIPFAIGVLTNITHEHLDYHKTMDRYARAKMRLLIKAKVAVVNSDDELSVKYTKQYLQFTKKRVIRYGLKKNADINPAAFPFRTKLLGKFNEYNALAAIAVGKELGIPDEQIRKGIASTPTPKGREEIVYNKDFTVMVDFAHTPNSIKQILQAVREIMNGRGRIIHVFGSASERDSSKRPSMGTTSAKYADTIILTAEDPRKESVTEIIKAIRSGISHTKDVHEIQNRKEAIKKAVSLAHKYDWVIITGKGHETTMNMGRGEEPWSDREAVIEALKAVNR